MLYVHVVADFALSQDIKNIVLSVLFVIKQMFVSILVEPSLCCMVNSQRKMMLCLNY